MGVLGNVANNRRQFPKLRVTFKRGYRGDVGLYGDMLGLEFPKIGGCHLRVPTKRSMIFRCLYWDPLI